MKPDYFKFCPRCAGLLEWKRRGNEPRFQRCRRCGYSLFNNPVGATEAVIVRNGRILMIRRAKEPRKGFWDFPGGFLEGGESSEHGIIREVKEELGAKFSPQHLLHGFADTYRWQGRDVPTIGFSYVGTIAGRLKTNSEVGRLRWFLLSRLPKRLGFKHMHQTLRDLKQFLKRQSPYPLLQAHYPPSGRS